MYIKSPARPTIGFLSTWSVYEGTTIDNYTHALLRGSAPRRAKVIAICSSVVEYHFQEARLLAGQHGLSPAQASTLFRLDHGTLQPRRVRNIEQRSAQYS
jgi:hypothetical protein